MAGLFHVFYNGFYGFLSFLFLLLTLVSPGDLIYQAYSNSRLGNIFVVAGVYIVTFLLAALIYACRILTNRSILAGIPKAWIPIEKPDLAKVVRRQIVTGLTRSAIIAQQSMPRNCTGEDDGALDPQLCLASRRTADGYFTEKVLPWGTIAHRGWTAPDCADLPSCHFDEVMEELPFLIEAKAVSLAPPDLPVDGRSRAIVPDARIVEILRRPKGMCMRTYLDYLGGLGVVAHDMAHSFVRLYERAKYSATPLSENEFRTLMHVFSALLHAMVPLDEATLAHVRESIGDEDDEGSDDDNNHTQIGYYSNPSRSWLSLTDDMSGRSDVGSVVYRPRGRSFTSYRSGYTASSDDRSSLQSTSAASRRRSSQGYEYRRGRLRQSQAQAQSPAGSVFRIHLTRARTLPGAELSDHRLPTSLPSSYHALGPNAATPSSQRQRYSSSPVLSPTTSRPAEAPSSGRYAGTLHPSTALNAPSDAGGSLRRMDSYSSYQTSRSVSVSSLSSSVAYRTVTLAHRSPSVASGSSVALSVLERMHSHVDRPS